jgi:acyl carrier protein
MSANRSWLLSLAQLALLALGMVLLLSSKIIPVAFGWSLPLWAYVIFFFAATVCGFYAVKLSENAERQRALAHMAGRPALNEREFGKQFFPDDRADIAAKLRDILSRHITLDLSQLQPDDRFVEDLRMDALDSLSMVEYVIEIEKEFGIEIPDSRTEKIRTFRQLVDIVANASQAKAIGK